MLLQEQHISSNKSTMSIMNGHARSTNYAEQLDAFRKSDADRDALVSEVIRKLREAEGEDRLMRASSGRPKMKLTRSSLPTRRNVMTSAMKLNQGDFGRVS